MAHSPCCVGITHLGMDWGHSGTLCWGLEGLFSGSASPSMGVAGCQPASLLSLGASTERLTPQPQGSCKLFLFSLTVYTVFLKTYG